MKMECGSNLFLILNVSPSLGAGGEQWQNTFFLLVEGKIFQSQSELKYLESFPPKREHISKGVAHLKDVRTKTGEALSMLHHNTDFGQGDKLLREEWEQKRFDI